MEFLKFNDFINESFRNKKPMGFSKDETLEIAKKVAEAISKLDGVKCTVNMKTLEEDSFDLDYDGDEYDGGSYNLYSDGSVVNMAVRRTPTIAHVDDSVKDIIKTLKKDYGKLAKESVNESNKYSVEYSDGIRGSSEFKREDMAIKFAKDLIKLRKKNLQFVSVHKPGMSQTAHQKDLLAWWGPGSYWDNKAKKDKGLYDIQIEESITTGISTWKELNEKVMSKSAIKKAIKVIDKQIDTETGGDGEPLDNETLQALEQERERLQSMK